MAKRRTFLAKIEVESNTLDAIVIEDEIRQRLGNKTITMIDVKEEIE